jgi:hypothetical protein
VQVSVDVEAHRAFDKDQDLRDLRFISSLLFEHFMSEQTGTERCPTKATAKELLNENGQEQDVLEGLSRRQEPS